MSERKRWSWSAAADGAYLILARRVARVEDALARFREEILRGAAVLQAQITHGALYADRFDDGVHALVTDRVAVELQRSECCVLLETLRDEPRARQADPIARDVQELQRAIRAQGAAHVLRALIAQTVPGEVEPDELRLPLESLSDPLSAFRADGVPRKVGLQA